jgi:MoaA/NifB/PqqE/SkfB family radical SAM enzyme
MSDHQNALPVENFQWKLWIYTNYDCNLRCSYCLAQSSPSAPRRAISLATVQQLVDEAAAEGFSCVYFTGGEPLILDEIFAMLDYAAQRLPTILLTNAMLLKGKRLEQLRAINNDQLVIQVSLDGGRAEDHDAYRGAGTWARTVAGIRTLQTLGFRVRLSTTETSANAAHLDEVCAFHRSLGISEEDHFIRPLARRGFSTEGLEVGLDNLSPEITANVDGIYWHPLATEKDMLVTQKTFPLSDAVQKVREQLAAHAHGEAGPLKTFT